LGLILTFGKARIFSIEEDDVGVGQHQEGRTKKKKGGCQ